MAKSLRASKIKTNKSHLRAKVHQPVEDARIERLSAKLLKLASQPKEEVKTQDANMAESTAAQDAPTITEESHASGPSVEEMDIDKKLAKSNSRSRSTKVQKKRKAKVVFAVGKQHGKQRSGKGYRGPGVR